MKKTERKVSFDRRWLVFAVCLALSMGIARANECCEFAPPGGCVSTNVIPPADCAGLGGIHMPAHSCSTATGNCVPKAPGDPELPPTCVQVPQPVCDQLVSEPVPAVSGWGLLLMPLLLLTAGTILLVGRLRRAVPAGDPR